MRKKSGFTLVELLVVIAIMAILLTLITPALQKAREQAKKVLCSTNLMSNGQAFYLYAADNDDKLYIAPTATPGNYYNSYYSWGGVTMEWDYSYLGPPWHISTRPYERALNKYLPDNNPVYICPSDPSGDSKLWAPFGVAGGINDNTQAYYSSAGTSYQYNALLVMKSFSGYSKMSNVLSPETRILINEWPAFDVLVNVWRPDWWTDMPRWSFHDNGGRGSLPFEEYENGNNTCFVDGHVEYIYYLTSEPKTSDYIWHEQNY